MFKPNSNSSDSQPTTLIGPNIKVEGDFVGEGNITVEGTVEGSLKTTKDLHVGPSAKLYAEIIAQNIIVAGSIKGNVKAYSKIELKNTAKVIGDIETNIISVDEGAALKGRCTTGIEETPPEHFDEKNRSQDRKKKLSPIIKN